MSTVLGINCSSSKRNIGAENCQVVEGVLTGHIKVPKGWFLTLASETFNGAYVGEQTQLGILEPMTGCFSTVSATPETKTEESNTGRLSASLRGLPLVTSVYKKGYAFQSSVYNHSGDGLYDILEVYSTGIIKAALSKDGLTIKGFDAGMYEVESYELSDGPKSSQTTIKYQLVDAEEWNTQGVFLTGLDFNPNQLNGIIDVTLTGRADVSDQKIYIKAVWARNPLFNVAGFAAANLKLFVSGTADPISGAIVRDSTTVEYAITPTTTLTTSTPVIVSMNDASVPVNVAKVGAKYYKGITASITPVA